MHRRWVINRTNAEYVAYLSKAASITPLLAQVLINRGIRTASDVVDFLRPGLSGLSDPFELSGMKTAVERIKAAFRQGEKVLVHGDYDADGLTATAIMVSALRTAGIEADYFIPRRMGHGYGFNIPGVEAARKTGAKLIITVDCGISSFDAAALAGNLGIDLIITDHHEPVAENASLGKTERTGDADATAFSFSVPRAVAVINPKLDIQLQKLHILCGAGIAFKLAQAMALDKDLRFSYDDLLQLLDLAALGTVADVVPLVGENRIIVKEAMQYILGGTRPGLQALKQAAGIDGRQVKAGLLSFTVLPRINAAGRMSEARDVVRLLLSDKEQEAYELASWLDRVNSERQGIEEVVFRDALSRLKKEEVDTVVMLADKAWHEGVLGIVAAKLTELFGVPAFVFSIENGIAKGSARSIPALDLCKGLEECKDLLISFGGHKQAAGVRLPAVDLPAFEHKMRETINQRIALAEREPVLEIHAPARLSEINGTLMREFEMLEPFGYGNPEPLLGTKELEVIGPRVVGGNHLKMKLRKGPNTLDTIGFDMGGLIETVCQIAVCDAAFTPAYNDWNGNRYLQLILKGLRPSA